MIRETEKRLLPGAACAVLFVHGILGSPAQFAPFLPLVPQDWSFCNLLLQGHGGGARDFSAASMAVWREQTRQAFAELRAQHETVVIAAHSMGTLFAVQEAVRSPVEGLFLLNVPLHVHVRPRALRNAWLNYGGTPRDPWGQAAVAAYGVERDRNVLHYAGWPPRFFELFGEIRRTAARRALPGIFFGTGRACLRAERAGVCGESAGRCHDAPALRARLLRGTGGPAAAAVRLPRHAAGM